MRVWKKTLSMVLALSLALSLIVLPASAAGGMTVSVSEATAKAGESFTLDLSVADNTAFQALTVYVYYPKELTCTKLDKSSEAWKNFGIANFGDGTISSDGNPNDTENNDRPEMNMASFGYLAGTNEVPGFTEDAVIGSLTFTSAADADSMDAEIEVVVVKASDANGDIAANGSTSHVTIQGAPASIKSLTLEPAAVEVNGTDVTVTATALSTKDKPMSATLSVKPESDDVTVEGGKIIVSGKAQADSYTVTATDEQGGTAPATLTVTRATPVVTTVEITNGGTFTIPKTGSATLTFAAEVKDQFGDPIAADVTWTVNASGLTVDGNKVTVPSDATEGTVITATATAGGESDTKTVKLVKIEVTATAKENPSYGDTWAEILPDANVTAVKDGAAIAITKVTRTIDGQNVDAVKPLPGEYTVTVTATTAEGDATTEKTVTVGKLTINPKLDNQEFEYTGEPINAKDVEYTVEKTGEKVVLTASNAEDCVNYAEDGYAVTYTLDETKYPNYVLGKVEGGRLMITKAKVDSKDVNVSALQGLMLDDEFEIDLDGGKLTVRIPSGSYTLSQLRNVLKSATEDAVLTVKDGKDTHRFTIESWALDGKDSDFDDEGVNTFVADKLKGADKAAEAFLENHAPVLPTFTVRMTASSGGGSSSGGASGGWDWGNRGNQTINLTPNSVFTDVPDGHTFQKDIMWVYYRGIMKGTGTTTFSPASSTNRQQLWMVLGRLNGSDPADMATARAWAINTGVSDGSKATGSLTRQQMVTMLYRWAQSKGYTGVTTGSIAGYNDASSVAAYARDAMTWAVGNGIISGSGNNLMPNGTATRGQFAAILHRFCEKFGV